MSVYFVMQDSWESQIYRCTVCLSIFSDELSNTYTPFVVCDNMHNLCMGCIGILQRQSDCRCPCCRGEMKTNALANRDLVYLIHRMKLPCGLCENTTLLSCKDAQIHSLECPETMVTCPMIETNVVCHRNMPVSQLWNHCVSHHNSENSNVVHKIDSTTVSKNVYSVTLSCDTNCITSNRHFFEIQDSGQYHRLCLHVEKNTMAGDFSVYIRRFFNNSTLTIKNIVFSIEVGDFSGMILQIKDSITCHEQVSNIDDTYANTIIHLSSRMLHQMQNTVPDETQNIKMHITAQIMYERLCL